MSLNCSGRRARAGRDATGARTSSAVREQAIADALRSSYPALTHELQAIFRRRGVPAEEASDLAQETIVRTLVHLKRHGPSRDDVRPLVHTIARNLLVTRVRRRQPELVPLTPDEELVDETRQPLDEILDRERRQAVRAALAALTPRHRRVVSMWMEGMTPAQIARELGIKRNAADALLHRARRRLASNLGPSPTLGLVAAILVRLRGGARRFTDTLGNLDPTGSLAQATAGLAAVGMAALLVVTTPAQRGATEIVRAPDEATRSASAVEPVRAAADERAEVRAVPAVRASAPVVRRQTEIGVRAARGADGGGGLEAGVVYRQDGDPGVSGRLLEPLVDRVCSLVDLCSEVPYASP